MQFALAFKFFLKRKLYPVDVHIVLKEYLVTLTAVSLKRPTVSAGVLAVAQFRMWVVIVAIRQGILPVMVGGGRPGRGTVSHGHWEIHGIWEICPLFMYLASRTSKPLVLINRSLCTQDHQISRVETCFCMSRGRCICYRLQISANFYEFLVNRAAIMKNVIVM